MRGLRLLPTFVVLCGLVGSAAADAIEIQSPVGGTFAFGNRSVAAAAATGTVVLNETGPNDVTVTGFSMGAGCAEFTATAAGLPVTFNNQLDVTVTYDPVDRGADSCVVTILGTYVNSPLTFTLTGTGTAALLVVQSPAAGAPLTFADQLFATGTGETKTITVVNNGNEAIAGAGNITATLTTGTQFSRGAITPATAGFPIDPGETATLAVTFNPTSAGTKTDTVTFTVSNDLVADGNPTVTVSGKGTPVAIASVPASVVFPAGAVGSARTADLVVNNTGGATLTISSMTITGTNAANFVFTDHGCAGQTCNSPGPIAAAGTSTFVLRCTPTVAGLRAAVLTVNSDDTDNPVRTVGLKCTGNNLDFGADRVGPPATAAQNVSITNANAAAITYSVVSSAPAEFPVTCAGSCAGRTLASGATETMSVTFQAAAAGARSATLTFTTTDPDTNNQVVNLTGTGTEPTIAVAPSPLAFGDIPVAQAGGATQDATITNGGSAPLIISAMTITDDLANQFSFATGACPNGHACNNGFTINDGAGNTATVTVRCDPDSAGAKTANLVITSDAATSPTTVPLTCTGTVPAISVSASSHDFGSQRVGSTSGPFTFTISNGAGAAPLIYTISGAAAPRFTLACPGGDPLCLGRTLLAGQSTTFDVTFSPTGAGMVNQTIAITTNDPAPPSDNPFNITVTGTGIESIVSAVTLDVGDVPVNGTATAPLVVTNTGTATLTISGVAPAALEIAGGGGQFAIVLPAGAPACDGVQSCARTIGPVAALGGTTSIDIRCTPTAAGLQQANLVIHSDATLSPTTVALRCTGTVPNVAVSTMLLDFGDQRVGVASAPAKNFTVSNSAAPHTAPMTYTVSETSTEYSISCTGAANCTGTLTAGQSITVSAVFTPTSVGVKADNITVSTPGDPDQPVTLVMVTGTGRLPSIAVAPTPLVFGDVPVVQVGGATSATTVTNDGLVALVVSSMAIANDPEGNFSFATAACPNGQACNAAFTLDPVAPPGNQATVTLRCDPAVAGAKTADLVIVSDAPTSPTTVPVTCNATVPNVAISTMLVDFGNQRVNTTSAPAKTFTVSNSAAAHTAPLAYTVSEASADYAITCTGAANCTGTLAAGESITVSVTFTPTTTGAKVANITVATPDDPDQPSTLVLVTGTGVEPAVTVDAPNPAPLAIGDVDVNATSAPGTITLRNSGTSDLSITAVALVGGDAAQFAIASGGAGALTLASTAGANTHSWTVTCTPTSIGLKTTTFRITHDAPLAGTHTDVTVTCTGRAAIFTASIVAPAKLDFGQVELNTDSVARTFTLTNTGNKAGKVMMLTSTSNVFVPSTMANLALDIAPNASITVSVIFHPVTIQLVNESVCAINNGLTSPVCVAVTGDGQSVGVDVSPPIDFGPVRFDAGPRDSANVTITNTGESSLRVDTITSSGAPFTIVNGPALPITLNLNQTTTFKVRLTPTVALGTVTKAVSVGGVFTVSGSMAAGSISVTARITAPQVAMTTDSLDFGMFDVDDPGTPVNRSVTITNTSDAATGADLHLAAPVLTAGAPDFAIVDGAAAIVAPGASATLTVRFDPITAGLKTGEVTLAIDALTGMTYTVSLRGLAIDQNAVCNPATITFPATVRRQASAAIPATVTNLDFVTGPGTAAMLDYTATITGANAADFSLPAADAAGAIAGNGMKTLPITFTPAAAGAGRTANLVVSYSDGGARSCMVTLVGEGRLRQINVTPGTIDFGTLAVGTTVRLSEVASALQLTSTEPPGATAATVTRLTTSGAAAAAFTVLDDIAKPLPTGGHVEYDVEFSPDQAGVFQADLDVYFDDDPDPQYTFHMTGRAVAVDLHGGGCDSGGGGAGVLVGLAALGLALGRRRARTAA